MNAVRAVLGAVLAAVAACGVASVAWAESSVAVTDDAGRALRLARPARRIVSLSPHATELLFAVGAGRRVVATERSSVEPPQARSLPTLSAYPRPDLEQVMSFGPDLVVVWGAAAGGRDLWARLAALGVPVYVSEPRSIEDVASSLDRLGRLAGEPAAASRQAAAVRERLRSLRERYGARVPVPVFVQVWSSPLMTLSNRDTIGDALRACGATNVFGGLASAAAQVDAESVLVRRPRMIVSFDGDAGRAAWKRLGALAPQGAIAYLPVEDSLQRPTPRLLDELERVCAAIDESRGAPAASGRAL